MSDGTALLGLSQQQQLALLESFLDLKMETLYGPWLPELFEALETVGGLTIEQQALLWLRGIQAAVEAGIGPGPEGPQGPVGPQGIPGPVGPEGPEGPQGVVGPEGPQGVQGNTGPAGIQGPLGPQGVVGPQGPQGIEGPAGPEGVGGADAYTQLLLPFTMPNVGTSAIATVQNAGVFGIGIIVYVESIGWLGVISTDPSMSTLTLQNIGYAVNQPPGSIASVGAIVSGTGPAGPPGAQGPEGPGGTQGPPGVQGPLGPQGIQGVQGPQGPQGVEGPLGPPGTPLGGLTPTQVLFGAADGTTAQNPAFVCDLTMGALEIGLSPMIFRMIPDRLNRVLHLPLNASYNIGTQTWTQDDPTQPSMTYEYAVASEQFSWWLAPPGNPPAWQSLATLDMRGFRLPGHAVEAFDFKAYSHAGFAAGAFINIGSDDNNLFQFITDAVEAPARLLLFRYAAGYPGDWAWYINGTLDLIVNHNVQVGGYIRSGSLMFMGAGAGHGQVLFLWDGNQIIGNGNLTFDGLTLGVWDVYVNGTGYFARNGPAYFGGGNQASFSNSGNLTAPIISCPVFYDNPTFVGNVGISGTAYHNVSTHSGVCYFGAGNQSYFDANGYLSSGVNGATFNGLTTFTNHTSFPGGANIRTDGMIQVGFWGINYLNYGGEWHATKWDGSGNEMWVDGVQRIYIAANVSDERVKQNLQPSTEDALAALRTVPLFSFDMPNSDNPDYARHFRIGFTAQSLQPIVPEAVLVREDTSYVDVMPLVAYLVKAVQQLADRVYALEAGPH